MKDVKKNVCVCVNSAYAYSPSSPAVTVLVSPYISAILMAADMPLGLRLQILLPWGDAFPLEGSVQCPAEGASSPGLSGDLLGWRLMTNVGRGLTGLTGEKAPASEATLGVGETVSGTSGDMGWTTAQHVVRSLS